MTAVTAMPPVETSWGPAEFFEDDVDVDPQGNRHPVRLYAGSGWTVACLHHGRTTSTDADQRLAEICAENPMHWCPECEAEWRTWEQELPPIPALDLDADRVSDLAEARELELEQRRGR